jgi:hypothetical protein
VLHESEKVWAEAEAWVDAEIGTYSIVSYQSSHYPYNSHAKSANSMKLL